MASKAPKQTVALEQPVDIALLRNKRWNEADARQVLAAWTVSGLSLAAFAEQHDLGAQRLYWWKNRLDSASRVEPETSNSSFIPVLVRPDHGEGHAPIVLRLAPRPELEIREPERVPPRWLATLLRELVEVSS